VPELLSELCGFAGQVISYILLVVEIPMDWSRILV